MDGLLIKPHLDSNGEDLAIEHVRRWLDYNPETGVFTWKECLSNVAPIGSRAGHISARGYVIIQLKGHARKAHRLAWLLLYGVWPDRHIDHINLNKSDNRVANLRLATCSENQANTARRKGNKSGYKGVRYYKGKWLARIGHQKKSIHLGSFDSPQAAFDAYAGAAREIHGEFARAA